MKEHWITVGNTAPSKVTCGCTYFIDCTHEPAITREEVDKRIQDLRKTK